MPKTTSGKELVQEMINYVEEKLDVEVVTDTPSVDIMGSQKNRRSEFRFDYKGITFHVQGRFLESSGGTVIEKLPYIVECLKNESKTAGYVFLVLEGKGFIIDNNCMTPFKYASNTDYFYTIDLEMFKGIIKCLSDIKDEEELYGDNGKGVVSEWLRINNK